MIWNKVFSLEKKVGFGVKVLLDLNIIDMEYKFKKGHSMDQMAAWSLH